MTTADPGQSLAAVVADLVAEADAFARKGLTATGAIVRQRIAALPADVRDDAIRTSYAALVTLRIPLLLLPESEFPQDAADLARHVAGDRAAAEQTRRPMPEQRAPTLPKVRTIADVTDPAERAELERLRSARFEPLPWPNAEQEQRR